MKGLAGLPHRLVLLPGPPAYNTAGARLAKVHLRLSANSQVKHTRGGAVVCFRKQWFSTRLMRDHQSSGAFQPAHPIAGFPQAL